MRINIVGKNMEVTNQIKETIKDSLARVDKYFVNEDVEARVVIKEYPEGHKAEINLIIDNGHIIRQEVMHEDIEAAVDIAAKKIEDQIRTLRAKIVASRRRKKAMAEVFVDELIEDEKEVAKVTRRKTLDNKPMTEAEAILQFELSGHDFYVFEDFEAEQTKVIYKRKDGEYGIIEIA